MIVHIIPSPITPAYLSFCSYGVLFYKISHKFLIEDSPPDTQGMIFHSNFWHCLNIKSNVFLLLSKNGRILIAGHLASGIHDIIQKGPPLRLLICFSSLSIYTSNKVSTRVFYLHFLEGNADAQTITAQLTKIFQQHNPVKYSLIEHQS